MTEPIPLAAAKAIAKKKSSRQPVNRRQIRNGGRGAAGGRRPFPTTTGTRQPHVGILVAEWVFGAVLISTTVPLEKTQTGYQATVTTMMMRLTGLTGVFIALALASEIPPARRFAIWFGLLVDLGILYRAANTGALKTISKVFTGQSVNPGGTQLAADYKTSNVPQPTGLAGQMP